MPSDSSVIFVAGPSLMHDRTKAAMTVDYSPREERFKEIIYSVRQDLATLLDLGREHTVIPLQGGGTYAIEAAIGTIIPKDCVIGILANGSYADRAKAISEKLGLHSITLELDQRSPISGEDVDKLLMMEPSISWVYLVHCETQSGIVNALEDISLAVSRRGLSLLVDAMSTVGCLDIKATQIEYDVLIATANKCIEGPPGVSFVVAREDILRECQNRAPTFSLDLYSQWEALEVTGEFRFTPPTHVLAGVREALVLLTEEGGVAERRARYSKISSRIYEGFTKLGIEAYLASNLSCPAVVTFVAPRRSIELRERLVEYLYTKGYVLYRSRLSDQPTFQVGCMGQLSVSHVDALIKATSVFLLTV